MLLWVLAMAVAQAGPCATDEVAVLSCRTKTKQLALCAGPTSKPTYLQYRFGPPGKPELVFPEVRRGFSMFRYEQRALLTGTSKSVTFTNDKTTYEVWWQDGKDGGTGVNIKQGEKVLSHFACTELDPDNWEFVEGAFATGAATSGPPDPLAGKSQKEICENDSLLLLKYSFDDLRFKDGFKKNCCVKGALGDDDRCELDWPSSDVPACSEVDLWRNNLFARYGYPFKDPQLQKHFGSLDWYKPRADFDGAWLPAVAQKNVEKLKALVAARGCEADAAKPSAACESAGVRWSLELQKGAGGQMDGMQQSDIADVIKEQCASGWNDAVATCLASGKKGSTCLTTLTDAQKKAAWSAIKAISPDVKE